MLFVQRETTRAKWAVESGAEVWCGSLKIRFPVGTMESKNEKAPLPAVPEQATEDRGTALLKLM